VSVLFARQRYQGGELRVRYAALVAAETIAASELETFEGLSPASQGQNLAVSVLNLAVSVLYVPYSGRECRIRAISSRDCLKCAIFRQRYQGGKLRACFAALVAAETIRDSWNTTLARTWWGGKILHAGKDFVEMG